MPRRPFTLLSLVVLALSACRDDTGPNASGGTMVVTVATTGSDRDADGYALTVDGSGERPVGPDGRIVLAEVAPGRHTLGLSGLAANCAVVGPNPRGVTLTTTDTLMVPLTVACTATTGALRITTVTSGSLPDRDGYVVLVDEQAARPIGANETLTIGRLTPGLLTLELTDL